MSSTFLFCGGGSLGHVLPSIAVAQAVKRHDPHVRILFVCSRARAETEALRAQSMPYRTIFAGKFPRGLTVRWFTFPPLFFIGIFQALLIVAKERPVCVFSKAGFVSVPVCLVAFCARIPIVLHESDSVMGLGSRMIARLARIVCLGFPTERKMRSGRVFTGNPVRTSIRHGKKDAGKRMTGFSGRKPVLLFIGGSQGAQAINAAVNMQLDALLAIGDIIHLTGYGKMTNRQHAHYWAREMVHDELADLYAFADIVVTRAGASVLAELALLAKPTIVIPLRGVAHDHQQSNAVFLAKRQAVILLPQQRLSSLTEEIISLLRNTAHARAIGQRLGQIFPADADEKLASLLLEVRRQD